MRHEAYPLAPSLDPGAASAVMLASLARILARLLLRNRQPIAHAPVPIDLGRVGHAGDGLRENGRVATPLRQGLERVSETEITFGPVQRHALAGPFLQGGR